MSVVEWVNMDYQAAAPVESVVLESMRPYLSELCGNPSSTHSFGQQAKEAVERSRESIARLVGDEKKDEVLFT